VLKPLFKFLLHNTPILSGVVGKRDEAIRERDRLIAELTARLERLAADVRDLTSLLVRGAKGVVSAESAADGLPVPHRVLRRLVTGVEDLDWFLRIGRAGAETVVGILQQHNIDLARLGGVLDFGCGCGRIMRHLARHCDAGLHGCDVNPVAVEWCRAHLPFGRFAVNGLEPPLPYADRSFGLVYAFSVFTHLPEPLQFQWMAEMRRVLKPGGYLMLSLMGERLLAPLAPAERDAFAAGNVVVTAVGDAGTNGCGAYHPERYVREVLGRAFDVVQFIPEGARGNPPQDLYLLRAQG
jgi:SAM-dependent methyltransferase